MSVNEMNRQVVLSSRPIGVPQATHFTVQDVPVPALTAGQFLVRAEYWSVDPAQRGWANDTPNYMPPVEIGAPMRGLSVGLIVESRNADYPVGTRVSGLLGWRSLAISDGSNIDRKLEDDGLPPSLSLGILGLNGVTAYLGLKHGCDPKPGETVVVSTAAGAVGSAVGQIAKIMGCRTVGITSNNQKMALCRDSFGYDAVISYKVCDLSQAIQAACPAGVDCYFDNTCGPISDAVMEHLAQGARITVCGTSALTEWDPIPVGPRVHRHLLVARARMQGFIATGHTAEYAETLAILSAWIKSGALTYREDILQGAEAAPAAIDRLYRGANTGKLLIKVN